MTAQKSCLKSLLPTAPLYIRALHVLKPCCPLRQLLENFSCPVWQLLENFSFPVWQLLETLVAQILIEVALKFVMFKYEEF